MKLEKTLMKLSPSFCRIPIKYQYQKIRGRLEQEFFHLNSLVGHRKRAIDIGANEGIYSYVLSRLCTHVESFEPQPWCTENLLAYSKSFNKNINIHNVGLADFNGSLALNIPQSNGDYSQSVSGLGSITTGLASFNRTEDNHVTIDLPIRQLDEYNFQDVAFIKIDVEGFESRVIEGSLNTIVREKPTIMIEVEARHLDGKSIEEIFDRIVSLGYKGQFIHQGCLKSLADFKHQIQERQNSFLEDMYPNTCINNFIFQPIS